MTKDARPDPKPRKNIHLWQSWLMWSELVDIRKAHLNRISAIKAGKSLMDLELEETFIKETNLDQLIKNAKKIMINYGTTMGPIWDWVASIKGIGEGGLNAQLLAQIDDIGKFATVSKLWRFAGMAVINGKRESNAYGKKANKNDRLHSICSQIAQQFIWNQTPLYIDIYYAEKKRQEELHPDRICITCTDELGYEIPLEECKKKEGVCPKVDHKMWHNPGHWDARAKRKMMKMFLSHLWAKWRGLDGLPVTDPYPKAILGHDNMIEPPE